MRSPKRCANRENGGHRSDDVAEEPRRSGDALQPMPPAVLERR
jgi:hypothetical protein